MTGDLNNLIRCLEIYLEEYVGSIDINLRSPDIDELKADYLLSFNYTDTYKRLYEKNIECCYIHGRTRIDSGDDNNMVLGIDDYLTGDERFTNTEFIEFKKYYQRIYKKTDCSYVNWLEDIDKTPRQDIIYNVYIFGHSLSMTDKDILTKFIENPRTRITVFYHSKPQFHEQIINLVHMLGPDKLNAMVYGTDPKVVFREQQEMEVISSEPETAAV